jgi:dsDNA-specific endonuclease/ATPase MutS2
MQKQFKEMREKFEEKRREVLKASPEMEALRKQTMELQGKVFQTMKNLPEMKDVYAEADAAWNELMKKAAGASPEIAKAIAERDELMKAARPAPTPAPAEKAKEKEEAK